MILVANKVDLVHLRQVSQEQGKLLANELKVSIRQRLHLGLSKIKVKILHSNRFHT